MLGNIEQEFNLIILLHRIYEAATKVACYNEKDIVFTKSINEWEEKLDAVKRECQIEMEYVNESRLHQMNILHSIESRQNDFVDM